VIWSGELRYTMWLSNGRIWIWRMPRERYLSARVMSTVEFGGGGVTLWDVFHGLDLALS
jgi:hypothetical protein